MDSTLLPMELVDTGMSSSGEWPGRKGIPLWPFFCPRPYLECHIAPALSTASKSADPPLITALFSCPVVAAFLTTPLPVIYLTDYTEYLDMARPLL